MIMDDDPHRCAFKLPRRCGHDSSGIQVMPRLWISRNNPRRFHIVDRNVQYVRSIESSFSPHAVYKIFGYLMRLVIEILRSVHRVVHGLCTTNPQVSTGHPQALWITWVAILEIHPLQPLTSWRAWAAGASYTPSDCFVYAKIKTLFRNLLLCLAKAPSLLKCQR